MTSDNTGANSVHLTNEMKGNDERADIPKITDPILDATPCPKCPKYLMLRPRREKAMNS